MARSAWDVAADILDPPRLGRPWYCEVADCNGKPHEGFRYKHARAKQRPPTGSWLVWLYKAGRGTGKTRSGGEFVKSGAPHSLAVPGCRAALIAATFADGRDVMVEGESGLLSILPPSALIGGSVERSWNRSTGELDLANGSKAKIYTSERPGQLRGPQHHVAWGDEPAKWRDATELPDKEGSTWSNLLFGLRLGMDPRVMLTTTPATAAVLLRGKRQGGVRKPGVQDLSTTVVTVGSTHENIDNLAPAFIESVIKPLEGTRLGRQEIYAEDIEDVEGALWRGAQLDALRRMPPPWTVPGLHQPVHSYALAEIAVAVDPSGGSTAGHDEQGIVVVGKDYANEGYVLDDRSCLLSPDGWGRRAVQAWLDWEADIIVAEVNFGGEMVQHTVRVAAQAMAREGKRTRSVPVHVISASRGKRQRFEPVAALFGDPHESSSWPRASLHMAGSFPVLEDEMTTWTTDSGTSPNHLDAMAWGVHKLFLDAPSAGFEVAKGRDTSLRSSR
jgi:phage terminase large subunit-like protein